MLTSPPARPRMMTTVVSDSEPRTIFALYHPRLETTLFWVTGNTGAPIGAIGAIGATGATIVNGRGWSMARQAYRRRAAMVGARDKSNVPDSVREMDLLKTRRSAVVLDELPLP